VAIVIFPASLAEAIRRHEGTPWTSVVPQALLLTKVIIGRVSPADYGANRALYCTLRMGWWASNPVYLWLARVYFGPLLLHLLPKPYALIVFMVVWPALWWFAIPFALTFGFLLTRWIARIFRGELGALDRVAKHLDHKKPDSKSNQRTRSKNQLNELY
jgi:hypothetical protein